MTTHLEDKAKSGIERRPYTLDFSWRSVTLCGMKLFYPNTGHNVTKDAPTCTICAAINAEHAITKRSPDV